MRFSPYWFGCRRFVVPTAVTLILCILYGLESYAAPQSPEDPTTHTISGTVINSLTHEPIGRALVYTADERAATLTDDHGNFELTVSAVTQPLGGGVPVKTPARLLVRKPGFLTDYGMQGSAVIGDSMKDVTLTLAPEALIVGQVKFPSADADYVEVQLYHRDVREGIARWEPLAQARTRADGEFRFADLRAGEYKVFTHEAMERDPLAAVPNGPAYGFPPRFFAAARDFGAADSIQLKAGETVTANIAPERQRYFDVRVPVIKPEPGPPGQLSVLIHAQGHRGPGFELGYDPKQNAVRGALPNGSYTIEAWTVESSDWVGATTITVANGPVNGPPLSLSPRAIIDYNVHQDFTGAENSRAGAPNVYVNLQLADEFSQDRGGYGYNTRGNPQSLTGVKPGRYWVQVNLSSSDTYVASVTSGGKDLFREPLVVPFGASVPPIDITVRNDPGEIEVTIEGKNNGPAAGVTGSIIRSGGIAGSSIPDEPASVYCIPLSGEGGMAREFSNQFNEKYVLPLVPPGDYRILAFDTPQRLEYRNPVVLRTYESKGQVVHVAAGQKVQVTVQPIKGE
ncbi:MAG TPA: hypothetical protein VF783_25035 [Terriglobales bacterium]